MLASPTAPAAGDGEAVKKYKADCKASADAGGRGETGFSSRHSETRSPCWSALIDSVQHNPMNHFRKFKYEGQMRGRYAVQLCESA
jgi:hypothetical protein